MINTKGSTILTAVFVGESPETSIRRGAVDAAGLRDRVVSPGSAATAVDPGSVCFVALPGDELTRTAEQLLRKGCHVFLDNRRPLAIHDLKHLDRTAQEAGVEIAVSRPLRFAPAINEWRGATATASLESEFGDAPDAWHQCLAESLDLAMFVCGGRSVARAEASVHRRDDLWPMLGIFSLRFDNGALALIAARRTVGSGGTFRCTVARGATVMKVDVRRDAVSLEAETKAFLAGVREGGRVAMGAAEALASARLLDQIIALLR